MSETRTESVGDATATGPDIVLETSELKSGYGDVPVLHGISLSLHEGEAVGVIGHNGMGKTTLLRTIMGLLPARSGRIAIDGVDVTSWPAHARARLGIGYVPQGRGILPGLSVQENLRIAGGKLCVVRDEGCVMPCIQARLDDRVAPGNNVQRVTLIQLN